MDLLTSSGSLVTPVALGKAVATWAAWRPFGGVDNGRFAASMHCACMDVVSEGAQMFWLGARGGEKKCPW